MGDFDELKYTSTNLMGETVTASEEIARIHEQLSVADVPHRIVFYDYNGNREEYSLSRPLTLEEE